PRQRLRPHPRREARPRARAEEPRARHPRGLRSAHRRRQQTIGRAAACRRHGGSRLMSTGRRSWRQEVTRYQWLVLAIASAGWVFDAFEGQIFNITRDQMLSDLLAVPSADPQVLYWGDVFLAVFLAGGTL